eukprot:scpid109356/ scgid27603/ 
MHVNSSAVSCDLHAMHLTLHELLLESIGPEWAVYFTSHIGSCCSPVHGSVHRWVLLPAGMLCAQCNHGFTDTGGCYCLQACFVHNAITDLQVHSCTTGNLPVPGSPGMR